MSKKIYDKEIIQNLSAISHEIQTPVNLIFSTARLVSLKSVDNPEIREYMENIINNCNKIAMLTGNIMDINLLNISKREYVETKQFFDTFCSTVKPYCEEENVIFKSEFKTEKEYIHIPIVTTERILLNLITNSIKYNDKAKKNIKLTISNDGDSIIFSVKDNGIGIAEKDINRITEKFFRADKSISTGSGLGMALIKEYLDSMGGTLTVKSQLKKGTEVTVSIPSTPENKIFSTRERDYTYIPEKISFDIEFAQFKNHTMF